MDWPKIANATITPNATTAASHASRLRTRAGRPLVRPRNGGTTPGGSVITSRVTKTSQKNLRWKTALIGHPPPVLQNPVPEAPVPQNPVPQNPVPQNPVPQNPVPQSPVPPTWDIEADVVVAGFGAAGACAALEATGAGAEVIVLDRF